MKDNNIESIGSKGGRARADTLSAKKRKEIARKGAQVRWQKASQLEMKSKEIPTIHPATQPSMLHIGDIDLPCAVLTDRTRVITESSVAKKLGRFYGGKQRRLEQSTKEGLPLPYFLYGGNLGPFVPHSLRVALNEPVVYRASGGVRRAINAVLLPEICEVWLKARENGVLQPSQERIAKNAEILMRGLAHIGITALVDEATGYQEVRDRDELHQILEAYIAKELLPWTKRFPDEFYEQLFRLRDWQYRPISVKRPKYIGKLTNELIYEKLPKGVLSELCSKNPVTPKGYRKYRHFQFLTEEIGNPHLEKQIVAVTTLMKVSPNWATFNRLFNRAYSPQGEFRFKELEEQNPIP